MKQVFKKKNTKFLVIVITMLSNYLITNGLLAQNNNYQSYIGFLTLQDQSVISYKVSFTEFENQKIEGFSITNMDGKEQTKTKLVGEINKQRTSISFKETINISTQSKAQLNEFCFIHVAKAEIKSKNGLLVIIGNFIGKYVNDSICTTGKIYLVKTEDKIKSRVDSTRLQQTYIENKLITENSNENHLKSNQTLGINWHSEKMKIELWDAAIIDGDSISIFLNDKIILENYEIKSAKKNIEIAVEDGVNYVKILALNEGQSPPNTVNFILSDNQQTHPITTNLKKGESTQVKIVKTKEIKSK